MTMMTFGISRKQAGVIFANINNGNLNLPEDFSKWMYDHIVDRRTYSNPMIDDVMTAAKNGLQAIFDKDIEKANDELKRSYEAWHIHWAEA